MVKHESDYNYVRPTRFKLLSDKVMPLIVFCGSMALYVNTMAPSIFWGNSSSLSSSNYLLGLADPPTYPLYTLIGRLFSLIPNLTPALTANLMSAFFAALSVMFFNMILRYFLDIPVVRPENYKKMLFLKRELTEQPKLRSENKERLDLAPKPFEIILPNLAMTSLFALSLPVWLSAVRAEVYSLQLAITLAALLFSLRGVAIKENQRSFFLGLWIYALSFANHPLMSMAFAPAFIYLIFLNGSAARQIRFILPLFLVFMATGISIYFYGPIRAGADLSLSMGSSIGENPLWQGLGNIWSAMQINGWVESGEYISRFKKIGLMIISQIGWPLIILSVISWWGIIKVLKKVALFFGLAVLGNFFLILWSVDFTPGNYAAVNFLAPLIGIILMICVVGTVYILRLSPLSKKFTYVMVVLIAVPCYLAVDTNYARADLSKFKGPDIIANAIIRQISSESIVITADDILMLPLEYYTRMESNSVGPIVISAMRLENQNYRKQLLTRYPNLIYPNGFGEKVYFRRKKAVGQICRLNSRKHKIYLQLGIPGITYSALTPKEILFEYTTTESGLSGKLAAFKNHIALVDRILEGNPHEIKSINFAGNWIYALAEYYEFHGQRGIANRLYKKAMNIAPENIELCLRRAARLARIKEYKDALKYIARALDIDSRNPRVQVLGKKIVEALEKQNTLASNDLK